MASMMVMNGVVIGGQGGRASTAGFASTQVGGVEVKFQPGDNLASRQVVVNGNMSLTLGRNFSQNMLVGGLDVRSQNGQLWVNGEKVDFSSGQVSAESKQSADDELASLQRTYPGVHFLGDPAVALIADTVKIAPGATVELYPGLKLLGDTQIGATAHVTNGRIKDSVIDGEVHGGRVEGSQLRAGSRVAGGTVEHSVLEDGSTVNGGNVERSTLGRHARVNGGNVERMTLEAGATVNGGNLEGFTLAAGQPINTGNHVGRLNSDASIGPSVVVNQSVMNIGGSGGVFIGGDVSVGSRIDIGDIVQGLRSGNFDAATVRQMSAFSRVANDLDVVINVGNVEPGTKVGGLSLDSL